MQTRPARRTGSEGANLCGGDVPCLLLRDVEEVKHTVEAHDSKSTIAFVKGNLFESFVNLDFGQTQVAVEVLAHHFQEGQAIRRTFTLARGEDTYPDFLFSPSVLRCTSVCENPYCRSSMHF